MEINKYKYKGNGKYEIIIDGKNYIIYEDVIIKNNILSKKNISLNELNSYLDDCLFYEIYYICLDYIKKRLRTSKEVIKYLEKKGYDEKLVFKVINKLCDEGYINNEVYARAYIYDMVNLKLVGPLKIKNDLLSLGVDENIIDKYLDDIDSDIFIKKINKYIEKELRVNKKSLSMFKNKVLNSLIDKGFYREDILSCLSCISFDDSALRDESYKKIYDKLSKKYSGNELEYKIKEKMYQKGFY